MHDDPGSAAGDRPQQPDGARDLWFLLFGVVLLAVGIWSESGISGQDEYWLSFRTVLEMQERGEWLTPYVDGAVRLQKPPLLYWLMLVNFELFGPSFFAARIWCALAGAGLAFATLKIHRLFGGRGYLAGLLVLAAAGVAVDSRRAMFDLPVGCLVTIAIWTTLRWGRSGRLSWLLGSAVALAAAALTKGPVALLFFAVPFVAALPVFRRPSRALPWRHLLPALALFLALALPWPLWVAWRWPEFWNVMNEQADSREFGFAGIGRLGGLIGACLGLVVPWSAMLLGSVLGLVRGRGERRAERWWWLGWCVLGALPFAFMKTFERYMLALVCPMALLVAAWLPTLAPRHQRAHLTVAAALLTLPAVLFAAFDLWFGLAVWAPLATFAVLGWVWWSARRELPDVPRATALLAVLLAVVMGFVYPAVGINALPPDLPTDLATVPVATFGRAQPGMLSMARGRSVVQIDAAPAGLSDRLGAFHGYVFVLDEDVEAIEAAAAQSGVRLERLGAFRSFYSRKAWLRFFRPGIGWDEWRRALGSRSPAELAPEFVYYRVG